MNARRELRRWGLCVVLSATLPVIGNPARADARKVVSEPSARQALHVTAYRAGYEQTAFLKEVREVDIPAGDVRIAVRGVPDTVQRESVSIRVLEGPPVEVHEQTFSYDVMTPAELLRAAQNTAITIDASGVHDGKLRPIKARVVAAGDSGTVFRTSDGYTFGLDSERHRFAKVPEGMTPRPTLVWHGRSATAGKRKIEISYLLTGLRWSADYVATLSRNGRQMDLSGWVTFRNDTAARFSDTNLAVAAGTVHRVPSPRSGAVIFYDVTNEGRMGEYDEPAREALGHLHLYKIPFKTTLEPNSIKNVRLLSLTRVPLDRRWATSFIIRPSRHERTSTRRPSLNIEMRNDAAANAGIPIPAGTVRVMMPDQKGTPQMVASSRVVDTPKGEKLEIDMGPVADVKVRMVPMDYRTSLLGSKEGTYKIEIRNGSSNAGVVRVDLRTGDYTTLEIQGIDAKQTSAATHRLEVPLGAGAARTIRVVATVKRPRR